MASLRAAALIMTAAIFCPVMAWAAISSEGSTSPSTQPESKRGKARAVSLTGCIDEENGQYVLVGDTALRRVANLEAVAFDKEGFAKFLGHKVTVTGQLLEDREPPVMRVHSIRNIAEVCTPEEPSPKK